MSNITVKIKASTGSTLEVEVDPSTTVADFKSVLATKTNIPVEQQRLIFSGHVLKDPQTLASYSVKEGCTIHLVKGSQPAASSTPSSTTSPTPTAPTQPASPFGGGLFGSPLGSSPFGAPSGNMQQMQQQLLSNPGMMRDMMNSPMMQSLLQNPELLRSIMMSNPQIREVIERNPEVGHVLNDPQTLRQTMEMARNPELMREMMRNTDRAMSNIESHPEGFNLLRRMYTNVQEPMMNAAQQQREQSANDPFGLFGLNNQQQQQQQATDGSTTTGVPNAAPLPNPWGSSSPQMGASRPPAPTAPLCTTPTTPSTAPSTTSTPSPSTPAATPTDPFASLFGGMPMGGADPFGGASPFGDMNNMSAMLQNPLMQQMMQQMFSNPEFVQSMVNSNPMLQQMAQNNPQMQAMLSNPELMQQMLNPQTINAVLQMQQAMQQLQGTGLMNMFPPASGGTTTPGGVPQTGVPPPSNPQQTPSSASTPGAPQGNPFDLFSQMMGLGGMGGMPGMGMNMPPSAATPQNQQSAAERFATQLSQLNDMGFTDADANLRALIATGGNIQAAIERLLSGL